MQSVMLDHQSSSDEHNTICRYALYVLGGSAVVHGMKTLYRHPTIFYMTVGIVVLSASTHVLKQLVVYPNNNCSTYPCKSARW